MHGYLVKIKKRYEIHFTVYLAFLGLGQAQNSGSIFRRVKNESGVPIPGANIRVKEINNLGTITSATGEFRWSGRGNIHFGSQLYEVMWSWPKALLPMIKMWMQWNCRLIRSVKTFWLCINPVAIDLRFVLASLMTSLNLERIGDKAENICRVTKELDYAEYSSMLEDFQLDAMFEKALRMMDQILKSIENKDARLAGKAIKKDIFLNKAKHKAISAATRLLKKRPMDVKAVLHLMNIVEKVERIGDLAKNISEEIIFHIEAKMVKHRGSQPKK